MLWDTSFRSHPKLNAIGRILRCSMTTLTSSMIMRLSWRTGTCCTGPCAATQRRKHTRLRPQLTKLLRSMITSAASSNVKRSRSTTPSHLRKCAAVRNHQSPRVRMLTYWLVPRHNKLTRRLRSERSPTWDSSLELMELVQQQARSPQPRRSFISVQHVRLGEQSSFRRA